MTTMDVTLDYVLALARRLRPVDQARLIVRLAPAIEQLLTAPSSSEFASRPPLRGLFVDLGTAPSERDITDIQHEMWATFPQDGV
jgi:hypothetical protein